MKIKITSLYIISFILLLIVMMEIHELVHISVGRIICGCWGERDFNVWELCRSCTHPTLGWIATLAGPVFSFAMMWFGMYLLSSADARNNSIGFAFIFTNIPFGRITTVMMGGGDEMVVLKDLLKGNFSKTQMILIGSALVFIIILPPLVKTCRLISNPKAWLYLVGFLTLPLVFLLLYTLMGLNTLLQHGFFATPWVMGTPLLITIHTAFASLALWWQWKNIYVFE